MTRPPTENMHRILDAMPDNEPIENYALYNRLGYAEGVGALLFAMAKRGLIEEVRDTPYRAWRKVTR